MIDTAIRSLCHKVGRKVGRRVDQRGLLSSRVPELALAWVICLLSAGYPVTGQAGEPADSLRFTHYTWENGLSQNTVTSITQDSEGYIWLATEDGVHRFDGNEMAIFRADPENPDSISESALFDMLPHTDGESLWLATYTKGIDLWNLRTGEVRNFSYDPEAEQSLGSDVLGPLFQGSEGLLWVQTDKGLDRIHPDSGRIEAMSIEKDGETTTEFVPLSITETADGTIWLGARSGLYSFERGAESFQPFESDSELAAELSKYGVHALAVDKDDRIWLATLDNLYRLGKDRGENGDDYRVVEHRYQFDEMGEPGKSPDLIHTMLFTSSGEFWLGTYANGVYWYDRENDRFENYRNDPADPRSLSDNYIWDIFEDRTGIVWIGTMSGGVNTFNPATRSFRHYAARPGSDRALPNRVVWDVFEDSEGLLWIGTEGGLSRLDRSTGHYRHYLYDPENRNSLSWDVTVSVREDSKGQLWIGTGYGVSRYRPESDDFQNYVWEDVPGDPYYANSISEIFIDDEDDIWTLNFLGLGRIDTETGEVSLISHDPERPGETPPSNYLYAVTPSPSRGGFWIGSDVGVFHFDPLNREFGQRFTKESGELTHNEVNAVLESSDGSLWVGTTYGLDRILPTGKVRHYGPEQGLATDLVYGLAEDKRGRIWISSNKGLDELDPETGEIRQFDNSDGLQSNEFNAGASFVAEDGEVFFGGINGFNAFYPEDIQRRNIAPTVGITKLFKFNEEVEMETPVLSVEELDVPWQDNVLGFEFAVFDYAAPEKNTYRYKLEGFDSDWLSASGHQHVTYTNLDPGSYTLRVHGANSSGQWSEEEATLSLHIEPPPWATWWAYLAYVLLTLTLITVSLRIYFTRLSEKHALSHEQHKRRWAETLQQLTQALTASLDAQQISEELLENLRAMVAFRKAVLFIEQGVDIKVAGVKGFTEAERNALTQLPASFSRFFAEVRHARKPRVFSPDADQLKILREGMSDDSRFLAIPAFSRADEFALLIIGRDAPAFSQQEQDIVSAFLTQALVALDNARLFDELQNLTTTDTLTQVNNRRYFFELAELEFNRGKRYERDVALILLDADHFKEVNDTYGRDIGDRMLKIIAKTCRNNLRHFDIIGRYGGEDFVILLPETPLNVAADVADRLRKSIEDLHLETHRGELRVTVSVGVAVADSQVRDLPSLINKADMALYEAKRAGRNRVVVAEQGSGPDQSPPETES